MALELSPSAAGLTEVRKGYQPTPSKPHQVRSGESFSSIATSKQLDAWTLMDFNFPGVASVPVSTGSRVVNWYLRTHFNCPETSDGKNRYFRGGETIYLPAEEEVGPTPLRARLLRVVGLLKNPLAVCMVTKIISRDQVDDAYLGLDSALRMSRYGYHKRPFDFDLARYAVDRDANHVVKKLELENKTVESDAEFAEIILRINQLIGEELSKTWKKVRPGHQVTQPHLSVIDEWVREHLNDPNAILHCYRGVFAIKANRRR